MIIAELFLYSSVTCQLHVSYMSVICQLYLSPIGNIIMPTVTLGMFLFDEFSLQGILNDP